MDHDEGEQNAEEQLPRADEPEQLAPEAPQPEADAEPEPEQAGSQALAQALRGSFTVLKVGMVALVVFYLLKGIFYVQPQEVRFKLRFGRVVRIGGELALGPGTVHVRWPWEELETVSNLEQTLDLGREFWTEWPRDPSQKKMSLNVRQDGFLITGDANIVHMKLRVRYRVSDDAAGALAYAFAVRDAEEILRRAAMGSTVKVVGSMNVMDVIERRLLLEGITRDLKASLADFKNKAGVPLGLEVVAVEAIESERVKNPSEPAAVRQAFFEAQNAASISSQMIEEARSDANAIEERAKAKATEIKAEAQGYKERLVTMARADAERMKKLLPVYLRSPQEAYILRDTLQKDAIRSVLRRAHGVFVLYDPGAGSDREIRFIHGRTPFLKKGAEEAAE